jgi:hypothetical protein
MMVVIFALQVAAAPVTVTARPAPVYIERSTRGQHLQFDFVLRNQLEDTVRLTSIRITATDSAGKPWYVRFIDESGSDPSIATLPRREIPGRASILIYNPFYSFPPDVPLSRLEYQFTLAREKQEWKVESVVEPVDYRQKIDLVIPLRGRMLVFEGHDYYSHHRRWNYLHPILQKAGFTGNSGRYAHDFSIVDSAGGMWRTDGKRNEDWLSWSVPIRAPGSGRVVSVENGMPDYDVGNPGNGLSVDTILARPISLMGNHVVIDHGNGTFSRLFHMRRGSARVRVGDRLTQGQVIGEVGFSGSVYTIHLHYEVGTGPGPDVDGLPAYFRGFRRVLGSRTVPDSGPIDTGEIVEEP